MRAELQPFVDEIQATLTPGAELLDVHTHLGVDEDGRSLDSAGLLRQLDRSRIARACVFALHDPERHPAYRVPNDRVLDWAAESGGRLIPFCRLDPLDGAVAEAERCLARGARGLKLHPRAQAFAFDGGAVDAVFRVAERAAVPVLVHAGRGMPPIAEGLCDVALRHPGAPLILAHAGIADQAVFVARLADHPAAFFDTSVFSPADLLELLARVPPERIVFGSDPPYGRVFLGLFLTVRAARAAGATDEQLLAILGGNARDILAGRPPVSPTAPLRPPTVTLHGPLFRITTYLAAAFISVLRGDTLAAAESVDLAMSACREPAPGPAEPALARIAPLLATVRDGLGDGAAKAPPADLLYLAMSLAATEPVPLP